MIADSSFESLPLWHKKKNCICRVELEIKKQKKPVFAESSWRAFHSGMLSTLLTPRERERERREFRV